MVEFKVGDRVKSIGIEPGFRGEIVKKGLGVARSIYFVRTDIATLRDSGYYQPEHLELESGIVALSRTSEDE